MESSFDKENARKELKEYVSPATEVIRYNEEDIILTSTEVENSGT